MTEFATRLAKLQEGFICACGQKHKLPIADILVGPGVMEGIPAGLQNLGIFGPVHLVGDTNTMIAAGDKLNSLLESEKILTTKTVYTPKQGDLVPDEAALGRLLMDVPISAEAILAVGSGTITDLVRFAAYKVGKPFISVPTAPSMDGYASVVAPLIVGGFKRTFPARPPLAIYADLHILRKAPMTMLLAGYGDLIGKFTAKADWQLGRVLHGEPYCEASLQLMASALAGCMAEPEALARRDTRLIGKLTEGLILSGIAIIMAGNSRPASGAEHLLSHYWEIRSLEEAAHYHLHGIKVGAATPLILNLYEQMLTVDPYNINESELKAGHADPSSAEHSLKKHFGDRAPEILAEAPEKRITWEERRQRIALICDHWDAIREIAEQLPSAEDIINTLAKAGAISNPKAMGLPACWVDDALTFARMLRKRYTILDLAAELGIKPSVEV
ncbi:MAG: sn-glycerol-1-phosphate dehydrogenase [Firmicutes bacterium]|nr:sn-glycerol-1-phosphate dehydrogenase [Bacillota bacterium]